MQIETFFKDAKEHASQPKEAAWAAAQSFADTYIDIEVLTAVGCVRGFDGTYDYPAVQAFTPDKATIYILLFVNEDLNTAMVFGYMIPEGLEDKEQIGEFYCQDAEELEKYKTFFNEKQDIGEIGVKFIRHDS